MESVLYEKLGDTATGQIGMFTTRNININKIHTTNPALAAYLVPSNP